MTNLVYLDHDNIIQLILTSEGAAQPLSGITKMTLSFGGVLIESDNGDTDPIRWAKAGYDTGEVRFYLGDQAITAGSYDVPLVVYDANHTNGIVWIIIPIKVIEEVEA